MLQIAWIKDDDRPKAKFRKPTRSEEVEAIGRDFRIKMQRKWKLEAEEIKEAPVWSEAYVKSKIEVIQNQSKIK